MNAIPNTMRAAMLRDVNSIVVEGRPAPETRPHEVLVQVAVVGTCGSDMHYYEHDRVGGFIVEDPLVLVHEPSEVAVAYGSGTTRHSPRQLCHWSRDVPVSPWLNRWKLQPSVVDLSPAAGRVTTAT